MGLDGRCAGDVSVRRASFTAGYSPHKAEITAGQLPGESQVGALDTTSGRAAQLGGRGPVGGKVVVLNFWGARTCLLRRRCAGVSSFWVVLVVWAGRVRRWVRAAWCRPG